VERGLHLAKRIEASGIFKLFSKPELGLVCFQLCDAQGKQSSELTKKLADKIKNV
jgi:glutamate/tyrosine decarboxylase-like PLP-dependent enzyme